MSIAKQKAIDFFMQQEAGLCDEDEKPQYPLQLDGTIEIAIKQAQKEFRNKVKKIIEKHGDNQCFEEHDCLLEIWKEVNHIGRVKK